MRGVQVELQTWRQDMCKDVAGAACHHDPGVEPATFREMQPRKRRATTGRIASAARIMVLVLLVLLCGSGAWADDGTIDGTITAIDFVCAAPIDVDGLTRLLPLHVGEPFRAEDLSEAERRLKLTQLFTSVAVEAEPQPDGVAIKVGLTRKVVMNAMRFRGNQTFADSDLRRVVRLQEGSPLTEALREYGVQRLIDHYTEQGFPAVQVHADVQALVPGEVDLTFELEEGTPLTIASMPFVGDIQIPVEELRKAVSIAVGSRYSKPEAQAAAKTLRRVLRRHDFYEAEVYTSWALSGAHEGTLEVHIDAGPHFDLVFSGNHYFGEAAILELMDLVDRPIITDGTWREMGRRARRAYQTAGFYEARVSVRVDAGPPRRVAFQIEEGERRWVGAVRFEGNRVLSEEQLRAAMATRPPSWWPWNAGVLVDDVLDDDLKRLWFQYRRFGFLDAQILDARREIDTATGAVVVVIVVDEGVQTRVDEVELVGFERIESLPESTVQRGQPFDADRVESERRVLTSVLFKAGYAAAQVEAKVSLHVQGADSRASIRFEAQPGELHRIGTIFVQNNIDTAARVILRELPFHRGEPLDPDALLVGQANIYKLGLFRTVSVRALADGRSDGPADGPAEVAAGGPADGKDTLEPEIGVDVSERFPGSLQWGFGYNTRDGFRGFGEVGYSNLQGQARRVSLRGDFNLDPSKVQPDEYLGNLGVVDPRLADTRWAVRANVIMQRATRSVDQFSIERLAFVPAIERPLLPRLTVGFEVQAEAARIFDVKRDVLVFNPRDEGHLVTIGAGPFAVYDGRDDPFDPKRGVFDSLRLKIAPAQFGTDVPSFKVVAQHSHYVPIVDEFTFVYAARLGWARTLRSEEVLPIRERFFLGGRTTVRGFPENSIGPKGAVIFDKNGRIVDVGGNPLGGDLVMSVNTELRYPIAFGLGGAVFFDAGGVYLQERPILIDDLRKSAGLGLRYATPVGPIGLDYGVKIDRRSGESVGEVHFSIGTIF